MAKILKGKSPDDVINEKIIQAGLKKYGKPLTPAEWAKEKSKEARIEAEKEAAEKAKKKTPAKPKTAKKK